MGMGVSSPSTRVDGDIPPADKAKVINTKITPKNKEHLPIEMFAGVFYWSGFF